MQSVLTTRPVLVLCELFVVAALVAWAWMGAGCGQQTAVGGADDDTIRITVPEAVERAVRNLRRPRHSAGAPRPASARKSTSAPARASVSKSPATLDQVVAAYRSHFQKLKGLTAAGQGALYPRPYLKRHGLKVRKAEFYAKFVKAFRLSGGARRTLAKHGFVVVPGGRVPIGKSTRLNRGEGPSNLYYRVFAADLPVYVTADSILHAWHRSFDELVLNLEEKELLPKLKRMVTRTLAELDPATQAGRDAYTYLAVARALLDEVGTSPAKAFRPAHGTGATVLAVTKTIHRRQVIRVQLLGTSHLVDGRRFIPRGRYARRWSLEPYFKAITWLSQVELLLHPRRANARAGRQEAAARALVAAMKASKGLADYAQLERTYGLLLGRPMAMTPTRLLALCAKAGLKDCRGEGRDMMRHYAGLPSPAYSHQISAVDRPAVRLSLLPRRFAYDVWATSRTTTPGLPPRRRFGRSMARDMDIAYVLGSDRALDRLMPEMRLPHRKHLPAALEAARRTLRAVKPTRVANAVTSHWLEALMALAHTDLDAKLPRVMRTAVWQDRKLEATLGSLVELRRDAGPLVHPSYGGDGCQYPKGYVEPIPQFFRAMSGAVNRLEKAFTATKGYNTMAPFFQHWRQTLAHLTRLADLQRKGKPMGKKDLGFLSRIVDRHEGSYWGVRRYDGWYPKLYWGAYFPVKTRGKIVHNNAYGGSLSKLALATLHVDMDNRRALQAGTGHPGLMVVAIDVGGKTALYGGPVYSYHRFERPLNKRMTDHEWEVRVTASNPARPRFTRAYHAR